MKDRKRRVRTQDKTVFKRTPHSRWSVRVWKSNNGPPEVYGCHHKCPTYNDEAKDYTEKWSWFIEDTFDGSEPPKCFGCGAAVPDYIQTIVRLHEGE